MLVGGLEHFLWLSIYWEFISSSQVTFTPSFFRGVGGSTTNQYGLLWVSESAKIIHCLVPKMSKSPMKSWVDWGKAMNPKSHRILWKSTEDHPLWILWKAMVDGDAGPQLRGTSLPRQTSQDVKPAGLQPSLWPMWVIDVENQWSMVNN